MATLKLKPKPDARGGNRRDEAPTRAPLRGSGSVARKRPTLAQAQAEREERERRAAEWAQGHDRRDEPRPLGRSGPPADRSRSERRSTEPGAASRPPARPRPDPRDRSRGPRDDAPDRRERDAFRGEAFGQRERHVSRSDVPGPQGRQAPRRDGQSPPERHGSRGEAAGPQGRHAPRGRSAAPSTGAPNARPHRPEAPNRAFGPEPGAPGSRQPAHRPPARTVPQQGSDASPASAPGSLRLSKYMGQLGIASRREADEWIAKGWVRVDGRVVSELGSRVMPGQQVSVDQRAQVQQAQQVTVLINKPVGYVSGQAEDGHEPAYVLVKPENRWSEDRTDIRWDPRHLRSLVPAGRLDIDSVGLLVLTQNGRIAKQLIGENSGVEKEYLVRVAPVDGEGLSPEGLALLRHGLELDGVALRPAQVDWVNDDQLRFVLREGRKRQIRRMCEAVGLQVLGLKRVRIGRVMLGNLPPGQWRYLGADEGFT